MQKTKLNGILIALTSKRNAQFQERSTPFDWSEILSPKPRGANNINNS